MALTKTQPCCISPAFAPTGLGGEPGDLEMMFFGGEKGGGWEGYVKGKDEWRFKHIQLMAENPNNHSPPSSA